MATGSSILAWKNSMDRGAWWATVHRDDKELDITECTNKVRKASSRTVHIRSFIYMCILYTYLYKKLFLSLSAFEGQEIQTSKFW